MRNERGIALVFVLFLLTTLSALAVSLTFLARTETLASGNYRLATQARYAAESGAQAAANFLLDIPALDAASPQYIPALVAPTVGGVNANGSPVTFGGNPVVLTNVGQSNYPDAATIANFQAAVNGQLNANNNTKLQMNVTATLVTEQSFPDSYSASTAVVQTWNIVADGQIVGNGIHTGVVEISATIEIPKAPAFAYAAFAANNQCQALWFHGSSDTNSYDSSALVAANQNLGLPLNSAPQSCAMGVTGGQCLNNTGGDVGTNGNLLLDGGAVSVDGDLSTPRTGVGNCNAGNITAVSGSAADVKGSTLQLPNAVSLPTPAIQAPAAGGNVQITAHGNQNPDTSTTCNDLGLTPAQCWISGPANSPTINIQNNGPAPLSMPQITLAAQVGIVLYASQNPGVSNEYDFNAISLSGGASIGVSTPAPDARVLVRVAGQDSSGQINPAINFDGGTFTAPVGTCVSCSPYDATLLQFVYGGTNAIKMTGNSSASATFYAPQAPATLLGDNSLYGALIANTIEVAGNANIFYDNELQNHGFTYGQPIMTAFSWKNKNN